MALEQFLEQIKNIQEQFNQYRCSEMVLELFIEKKNNILRTFNWNKCS